MNREPGQEDRAEGRLDAERHPFEPLSRRAHPIAEHRRVRGGVVVGMVRRMRHRQRVHEPAEEQEADSQGDREGALQDSIHAARGIPKRREAEY